MKTGDLVKLKFIKSHPPMIGIVMRVKSWETLNDIAIVWWGDEHGYLGTCHEYVKTLEVVCEGR